MSAKNASSVAAAAGDSSSAAININSNAAAAGQNTNADSASQTVAGSAPAAANAAASVSSHSKPSSTKPLEISNSPSPAVPSPAPVSDDIKITLSTDPPSLPSSSSSSDLGPPTRVRSSSDTNPWDRHDGGGLATYLPAPPSPRTPAVTHQRRKAPGTHTPVSAAQRDSPTLANPGRRTLQVPQPLGFNLNNSGVSMEEPLLSPAEQSAGGNHIHQDDLQDSRFVSDEPNGNGRGVNGSMDTGSEMGDADETEYDEDENIPSYQPPAISHSHKLGQWMATGICGNDITSSVLYVTGLCVADAGVWAPICLLMVAGTLYLFRKVYGEAVTALPLNGGAYNVLLNTTSKSTAAVAACLTILSYVATAVVSGSEAIHYLHILWTGLNVTIGTIVLLSIFAFLNLMGITDSARVAFAIFAMHMCTMTLLAVIVIVYVCGHGFDLLKENYYYEFQPNVWKSILYGFSSAMLGVSGFESSANFVEEQKEGVFVKTLRNMWVAVSVFNPLLAFLALCTLRQEYIIAPENQPVVLAEMGRVAGGEWLEKLVSADAFLVLSGGVLTSFVGVTGLCRRLALDRCLPQLLLAENERFHTNHFIILGFLGVCSSMYLLLNGAVDSLANVYSVSFMSVMGLFAMGNMLLKYKRGKLKREVTAPWFHVFLAFTMVLLALCGLLAKDTSILVVWCLYFFVTGGLMATMFFRVQTLKILYSASKGLCGKRSPKCLDVISQTIRAIGGQSIGFFAKSGKLSVLNKAILYVRNNEDCAYVRIIHVYESQDKIPSNLLRNVNILDEMYPKLKIDLVLVPGLFSPEVIDYLSHQLQIPKNLMFITCPKEDFAHKIETLGGVRLITH